MPTDEQQKLYENMVLAEEVDVWLKGPIGQFVMQQKKETEAKVLEAFRTVDIHNPAKLRALQRALDAANTGVQWLIDTVKSASQYEQILQAEKDESYG